MKDLIKIDTLTSEIFTMGDTVISMLEKALDKSVSLSEILEYEEKINKFHMKNDEYTHKFLGLFRPLGRDLRFAIAVMKINSEFERMADQALNIKRADLDIKEKLDELKSMIEETLFMARKTIEAFKSSNTQAAADIIKADYSINTFYTTIIKRNIELVNESKSDIKLALRQINLAKCLERIGDHCTNIAEDIIFLESGADIRHTEKLKNVEKL